MLSWSWYHTCSNCSEAIAGTHEQELHDSTDTSNLCVRPCDCPNAAATAETPAAAATARGRVPGALQVHGRRRSGAGAGAGIRPRLQLRGRAATPPAPP